ncbi:cytochrome P450 [Auricularia subglabra TFB-10046 SS5]|nr:cytochrome P450 [Auricularia subglabra TFB-10046 SS5]
MERTGWLGVAAFLGATVAAFAVSRKRRDGLPYPPGPRPRWLIGNMFDMPLSSPWLRFSEWGDTYGEITYATVFSRRVIVLNSLEACKEVMEVQGASASGRPWSIMHGLMGMLKGITGVQETPMWRYERRLTNTAFGPHVVQHALGKSIFAVTYGLPPEIHFDEFMRINDILIDSFLAATVPGRFLVESIPIRKYPMRYVPSWIPGAGFKRYADLVSDVVDKHASTYFVAVKKEIHAGIAPPSFVSDCLQAQALGELNSSLESKSHEEEALKWAASEMYRAGTHTTVQTAVKFVTAMQLFPDVQKRAQEEILRVVGPDRLPTIEDRDHLPLCPGRHLAANILFLTVSNILATVWISKELDKNGKEVPLVLEWSGEDAISFPHPFHPQFKPRSPMAVDLINAVVDAGTTAAQNGAGPVTSG